MAALQFVHCSSKLPSTSILYCLALAGSRSMILIEFHDQFDLFAISRGWHTFLKVFEEGGYRSSACPSTPTRRLFAGDAFYRPTLRAIEICHEREPSSEHNVKRIGEIGRRPRFAWVVLVVSGAELLALGRPTSRKVREKWGTPSFAALEVCHIQPHYVVTTTLSAAVCVGSAGGERCRTAGLGQAHFSQSAREMGHPGLRR